MALGLGRFCYRVLYHPTHHIRYNINHFGIRGWLKMVSGKKKLRKIAVESEIIHLYSGTEECITFNFLTGKDYWYQTITCIKSLKIHCQENFRVNFYSDGSLSDKQVEYIQRQVPLANYVDELTVEKHLNQVLPRHNFPTLRYLRDSHPFFRRLFDIHTSGGWSIHLDSDMIFYGHPGELISAHQTGQAVFMKERLDRSYYADDLEILKQNFEIDCVTHLNGGIVAYDNRQVNYVDLEKKSQVLLHNYPTCGPARLEQTLMSHILFQQNGMALNEKFYNIIYEKSAIPQPEAIVRHYIFKAKLPYFHSAWKQIYL
ncbi:MAG: hypothetical protein INR69_15490 [Mucilaginibacter polytrichastri]|nr:hypothetical protein [Mucilaginibacter polytrichastri]